MATPPPHFLLSALLTSLIINFAWGEVIDCNVPQNCYYNESNTKIFDSEVEFYNVNINTFSNSGELIFKERVFFDADTSWGDFATFTNNGVMTFYNDVYFESLLNAPTGTPQFNVLNFNANGGFVQGQIENVSMININGKTTFGNQVGNQAGAILNIKSPATFNDSVINWDGDTQIGGTIMVDNSTTFWRLFNYNNAKIIINAPTSITTYVSSYNSATIIIKSPTSVAQYLNNSDNATLEIKGTTLMVKNTLWNFRNATLIFSALKGTLGQLIGDFINYAYENDTSKDEGKVKIIVTGLTAGKKYQIINGTKIMLDEKDIEFIGGTGRYEGNGWIWIDNIFFNPESPLNSNQQIIKNALENLGINSNKLNQAVNDTDKTLQKSFVTQPKLMIKTFQNNALTSPFHSAYVSRLTASSKVIMNDSSNFINPLERASQTQFFATPFGGVFKGDALSGHLFGLSVGLTHIDDEYIAQGHFAYAKGQSTQDLATQSTELNGDLFQVGGFARLFYGKVETDINANFIFGNFSLDNVWLNANVMNSNSNFNNYQVNLGGVVGWRFGEDLSVKPFVGVQGYYENQGEFQQDSGLGLTSKAYNSMIIDAVAGLEGRYIFDNGSFIFAKASYESKLYNSHKEVFMRTADESLKYENETYDSLISANLGARVLSTQHFKLDIEALYKHYDSGLNYFGGNLGVKWSF